MTESYNHGGARHERPLIFPIRFIVKMRKTVYSLFAVFMAFLLGSCGNGKNQVKGVIKSINESTLSFDTDGDVRIINIADADFPNGKVMAGDSAIITFKGNLSSGDAQAEIVYLIPPTGNIINLQQLQEQQSDSAIKTKPVNPEKRKKFEQFLKMKH
jgi:hypothetical protein